MDCTSLSRRDALALLIALGVPGSRALAADATNPGTAPYRVLIENEKVRVLDFVSPPHSGACGSGSHWHPAHLSIYLTPARIKATRPDGTIVVSERKAGDVAWFEAATHGAENAGDNDVRILMVEVKDRNWRPS